MFRFENFIDYLSRLAGTRNETCLPAGTARLARKNKLQITNNKQYLSIK
jgi:hypothetical protein